MGGKGGVGRSTLSAALGLAYARMGKRTLIVELDTEESIPFLFGRPRSGYTPGELAPNLFSLNITPPEAQKEYGMLKLRSKTAYRLVFETELMKKMLRMIPGLRELLLLGKTWFMEQSKAPDGEPEWDVIVLDSPATGHGISLFRLPRVILEIFRRGPMAEDAKAILSLLRDPDTTSFNVVTMPEEMPANECAELIAVNARELHMPLDYVFVNQVWHPERESCPPLSSSDRQIDGLDKTVAYVEARIRAQRPFREQLAQAYGDRTVEVPFVPIHPLRVPEISLLAESLSASLFDSRI